MFRSRLEALPEDPIYYMQTFEYTVYFCLKCARFSLLLFLFLVSVSNGFCASTQTRLSEKDSEPGESIPKESPQTLIETAESTVKDQPNEALVFYKEALEMARKKASLEAEGRALNGIGRAHYILGNYHQSMDAFVGALKIRERLTDTAGIAMGYNNLGLIYGVQEQCEQAIQFHEKSLELCRDMGDSGLLFLNYFNISINYDALSRYEQALEYVEHALEAAKEVGSRDYQEMALNRKAEILCHKDNLNESIRIFESLLNDHPKLTNWEKCFALSGLAKAYLKLQQWQLSLNYGLEAYELANEMESKWEMTRALESIAETYAGMNQFEMAYHYQVQLKKISGELFDEYKESEINYLKLQREQSENQRLQNDNLIKEQQIRNQRQELQISIAASCIIVVLLIMLFSKHRNQIRLNQLLSERTQVLEQQSKDLNETNQVLHQLHDTKNKIYSIVAHDLRGPIGGLHSLAELAMDQRTNREDIDIDEILEITRKQCATIFHALENLLSWANSQRGSVSYQPELRPLSDALLPALNLLENNAMQKQITLRNQIDLSLEVYYDYMLINTVFRNLLSNAIKFTEKGGQIILSVQELKDEIVVSVADDGVGIPFENLDRITKPEHYKSTYGTNMEKGSGLGLKICTEFIQLHQGRIWVDSRVGECTVVHFTIPHADSQQPSLTGSKRV